MAKSFNPKKRRAINRKKHPGVRVIAKAAALGNIALGLAAGILMGGIGTGPRGALAYA